MNLLVPLIQQVLVAASSAKPRASKVIQLAGLRARATLGADECTLEVDGLEAARPVLDGRAVGLGRLAIGTLGRATVVWAKFDPRFPQSVFAFAAYDLRNPACAFGFDVDAVRQELHSVHGARSFHWSSAH